MKAWRPLLTAAVVVAALIVIVLLVRRAPAPTQTADPSATPVPTAVPFNAVLFFPGDDDLLHRETRELPDSPHATTSCIRLVVEELQVGSHQGLAAVFPWPISVDDVFVDRDGNAYVDLSAPPAELVAGTSSEIALAYATVSTVVANCPGVSRVQLLFGGKEVSTLGHLDLSRPLAPRFEFIAP